MKGDIVVDRISKTFGDKTVFENLSLVFPKGSRTCIMGESGSGKTTFLNILLGLMQPDSGSVLGMPDRVSVVFQEDRLCEAFSLRSNMKLVTDQDPSEIFRELEIGDEAGKPVGQLSGGQKRRAAIARALLAEGEVLILDEPFKGIDKENRLRVVSTIINRLNGRTLILVSHDEQEAEMLGANVVDIRSLSLNLF